MSYWAEAFGVPLANFRGPHLTWTDERIEAALVDLIGTSAEWPRRRDFRAAGLDGCYAAIWRGRGMHAWAWRMGVTIPAGRGGRPRRQPEGTMGVPQT